MSTEQEVLKHFYTADPVIFALLKELDCERWKRNLPRPDEYFAAVVNQIVSQQLSTKVADVINARLSTLVGDMPFIPETLLEINEQELRTVGLSRAKISYIKNLATMVLHKQLQLERLPYLSEEAVIAELIKVKGIGKWTAEMFLIFSLGKEDVFSYGDWGLKTAIRKLYTLAHYPTEAEAEKITQPWKPYRSYASFALWQSLEKKG